MKNEILSDVTLANLEQLIHAKRTGKHVLIKRTGKGAQTPSWVLAKVTTLDIKAGKVRVEELIELNLSRIEDVKFTGKEASRGEPTAMSMK